MPTKNNVTHILKSNIILNSETNSQFYGVENERTVKKKFFFDKFY